MIRMTRGLGKGLNSLIPEIYDEDFDSNAAQSLEDMLNENTTDEVESIDETTEKDEEVNEDEVDDSDEKDNEDEEKPDEEIQEESIEDIPASEDVPADEDSKDDLSDSQDVKKQENVAEVLDIVDKNPRITLWSSRSAAVFRYLRKTEPEFSISREASILIDEAVSKKYPEIWDLFEDLK
ncbi:MAG: AAA family ATPase [Methanobrevibacter sp.]|nr:AAA family ATPase [Methanobrevibacter sp.]